MTCGTFAELADRAELDVRRIIEKLDGHGGAEGQIRDLYASMMNEDRIEALGAAPIQEELDRIEAIDSPTAFARETGRLSAMGAGGPFGASALRAGVGYPEQWRTYTRLHIRTDDLLGNAQRAQKFENDYQVSRLRRRFEPR